MPGTVTVQGKRSTFTQISNSPNIDRFIDTKIIASFNNITEATYIAPSTTAVRGD